MHRPVNYHILHPNPALKRDYTPPQRVVAPVLAALRELGKKGRPVAVAIDGRCGSGKTGLAAYLEKELPCILLHMDDYYLPFGAREENWQEIPAGNMDLAGVRKAVADALEQARVRSAREEDGTKLPPVLLEGSYSGHPELSRLIDLRIFLTCSRDTQEQRLRLREGAHYQAFENVWIPMEERYFRAYDIERTSDLVLSTDDIEQAGESVPSTDDIGQAGNPVPSTDDIGQAGNPVPSIDDIEQAGDPVFSTDAKEEENEENE